MWLERPGLTLRRAWTEQLAACSEACRTVHLPRQTVVAVALVGAQRGQLVAGGLGDDRWPE